MGRRRETRPRAREAAAPAGTVLAGLLAIASFAGEAWAQEQPAPPAAEIPVTCSKSEFESAVDHAAETLRELNNKNRPPFQAKLRQLKERRGWNDSQFLKEAEPFVKDERISDFDTKTNELLMSISSMGQEGANAPEPDCKMLADLRSLMQVLVDTQSAKWTYMVQKLESELAK